VAQDVGPEFKPQYWGGKKKRKEKKRKICGKSLNLLKAKLFLFFFFFFSWVGMVGHASNSSIQEAKAGGS
jgi:cell division protein FtsB